MSSQSAVCAVRRILNGSKAGHTGTLDPGAAGVLPVCVGRATKLARFLVDGTKEYVAELTLGVRTDTLDSYGTVIERRAPRFVSVAEVEDAASHLTGQVRQRPPAYSAVKINGRPLYSYTRNGDVKEAPERTVTVDEFKLVRGFGRGPFVFRIVCSKGTYVRVLMEDLARTLGEIGTTTFLERTRVGQFHAEDAVTFSEIEKDAEACLIAPQNAVQGKELVLPRYLYDILASGARILPEKVQGLDLSEGELYRVFCREEFFGMGMLEDGALTLCARVHL